LFFKLFRCKDKTLRQMLYSHIVTDIKNLNEKHRNQKVNRTLQNFMYTMLNDPSEIAAKKSLDVMIDLYRKRIWFAFALLCEHLSSSSFLFVAVCQERCQNRERDWSGLLFQGEQD